MLLNSSILFYITSHKVIEITTAIISNLKQNYCHSNSSHENSCS